MSFGPDILVVSPNDLTTHLLVEVGSDTSVGERERALKRQMIRMRVPTGLLVTPSWITVYRDTFRSYADGSIDQVDRLRTSDVEDLQILFGGKLPRESVLEDAVESWLAHLKYRLEQGYLRGTDLNPAVREHLLPALSAGEIQAAGPRSAAR